jgi:hypothetical protein
MNDTSAVEAAVLALAPAPTVYAGFTMKDLPSTVVQSMMSVEKYAAPGGERLTGPQKKEVVTRLLAKIVDDSNALGSLEPIFLSMVPYIIDTLVQVDRDELVINEKTAARARGCWDMIASHVFCHNSK